MTTLNHAFAQNNTYGYFNDTKGSTMPLPTKSSLQSISYNGKLFKIFCYWLVFLFFAQTNTQILNIIDKISSTPLITGWL